MTSDGDPIRGTRPRTRADAGPAPGWRCPPDPGATQEPRGDDRRTGEHCYWPDHCSRPSHPRAQPLRSASAPEGPERSGGGAQRLAAVRNARATLPGDGLGPALDRTDLPSCKKVESPSLRAIRPRRAPPPSSIFMPNGVRGRRRTWAFLPVGASDRHAARRAATTYSSWARWRFR